MTTIRLLIWSLIAVLGLFIWQPAKADDSVVVQHVDLDLRLDPVTGRLDGRADVEVTGRGQLRLALSLDLSIDLIEIDGAEQWNRDSRVLEISGVDNGRRKLTLHYTGQIRDLAGRSGGIFETNSIFLLPGAGWWPIGSEDTVPYRLTVRVPAPLVPIASGTIEHEEVGKQEENQVTVSALYPAEAPTVFAGLYEVTESFKDGTRYRAYFTDDNTPHAQSYLDASQRYIEHYASIIGPYPFDSFHIISSPLPVGLGFPNLTYISERIVPLPFMKGRSLAHEVVHNWWGNGVYVDYQTGNWAEGLTTYMADYGLAAEQGQASAAEMRLGWLRDYAALAPELDKAVTAFTGKQHDADQVVGYNKVAALFHMLERRLGRNAFYESLRDFWIENKFKVAGWADLEASFSKGAGESLEQYFSQWIDRAGAPNLSLSDVHVTKNNGQWRLDAVLSQNEPLYELSVPVRVTESNGSETVSLIHLSQKSIDVQFETDSQPVLLQVDPDSHIFRHLAEGEAPPIFRDLTLHPDAKALGVTQGALHPAVEQLSHRLIGASPRTGFDVEADAPSAPILVMGLTNDINPVIAGLASRPDDVNGPSIVAAGWIANQSGRVIMVVEAESEDAFKALARRLPHYRGKSFVTIDREGTLVSGVWPKAYDHPLAWQAHLVD